MAVKIRLARIGKKHHPFYRIVAVDGRRKRDGAFLANLGTYDAIHSRIIRFDETLYDSWIKQGAQVTDSAQKIHRMYKKDGLFLSQISQHGLTAE